MGSVFEKFQRERDKQIENETYERIEKAMGMLRQGSDVEEVSKETGFHIERIKRLERIINHNND